MARHDTRDDDTGRYTERDPFDMSGRIPRAGSAARGEPDKYSSLNIDLTDTGNDGDRMASGVDPAGAGLYEPAGSVQSRDWVRDDSANIEAANKAKAPSATVRRARENDWTGPQASDDSAYNRGTGERKDTSWG